MRLRQCSASEPKQNMAKHRARRVRTGVAKLDRAVAVAVQQRRGEATLGGGGLGCTAALESLGRLRLALSLDGEADQA